MFTYFQHSLGNKKSFSFHLLSLKIINLKLKVIILKNKS